MVVVKVRETYDLATVKNKMTLIAVHSPKSDILKKNYPGLLMQCKSYRPLKASVRIACASVLPLDPQGVGLTEDDVAPEDVFNPILYKAMTNVGLSQLEARILALSSNATALNAEVDGETASIDVDTATPYNDEFPIYYGLLANAHGWRHASPQQGLSMNGLKPLVYEMLYNAPDQVIAGSGTEPNEVFSYPGADGNRANQRPSCIRGNAKVHPFINCTSFSYNKSEGQPQQGISIAGFPNGDILNAETIVPYINCCVAAIIIPPSRLHQFFYRMVVEWDVEFSGIRPIGEIANFYGLVQLGNASHYQNYNYANVKEALTGDEKSLLDNDTCMVSANVDVQKVM